MAPGGVQSLPYPRMQLLSIDKIVYNCYQNTIKVCYALRCRPLAGANTGVDRVKSLKNQLQIRTVCIIGDCVNCGTGNDMRNIWMPTLQPDASAVSGGVLT